MIDSTVGSALGSLGPPVKLPKRVLSTLTPAWAPFQIDGLVHRHRANESARLDKDGVARRGRPHAAADRVGGRRFALLRDEDVAVLQADEPDARGVDRVGDLVLSGVVGRQVGRHIAEAAHEPVERGAGAVNRESGQGAVGQRDVARLARERQVAQRVAGNGRVRPGDVQAGGAAADRIAAAERERNTVGGKGVVTTNEDAGRVAGQRQSGQVEMADAGWIVRARESRRHVGGVAAEFRFAHRIEADDIGQVDAGNSAVLNDVRTGGRDRVAGRRVVGDQPVAHAVDRVVRDVHAHGVLDADQEDAGAVAVEVGPDQGVGRRVRGNQRGNVVVVDGERRGLVVLEVVPHPGPISFDGVALEQPGRRPNLAGEVVGVQARLNPGHQIVSHVRVEIGSQGDGVPEVVNTDAVEPVAGDQVAAGDAVPAETDFHVFDDVVLDRQIRKRSIRAYTVGRVGVCATRQRNPSDVRVVALEGESVDGHARGGDRKDSVLIAVGLDQRFRPAAVVRSAHAGVGPVDGQRLVDCHVFVIETGCDDDCAARARQVDGALNRLAVGDVDHARMYADVTERWVGQVIVDLGLDGENFGLRGGRAEHAVKSRAAGIDRGRLARLEQGGAFQVDVVAGLAGEDQVVEGVAGDGRRRAADREAGGSAGNRVAGPDGQSATSGGDAGGIALDRVARERSAARLMATPVVAFSNVSLVEENEPVLLTIAPVVPPLTVFPSDGVLLPSVALPPLTLKPTASPLSMLLLAFKVPPLTLKPALVALLIVLPVAVNVLPETLTLVAPPVIVLLLNVSASGFKSATVRPMASPVSLSAETAPEVSSSKTPLPLKF